MEDLVRGYYRAVDSGEVERLLQFFDPSIRYVRPGFEIIQGMDDLRDFYNHVRPIRRGEHQISQVLIDGRSAAAHGEFIGVLHDGRSVAVGFADFMRIGPTNKIRERFTYFFAPAV